MSTFSEQRWQVRPLLRYESLLEMHISVNQTSVFGPCFQEASSDVTPACWREGSRVNIACTPLEAQGLVSYVL